MVYTGKCKGKEIANNRLKYLGNFLIDIQTQKKKHKIHANTREVHSQTPINKKHFLWTLFYNFPRGIIFERREFYLVFNINTCKKAIFEEFVHGL